MREMGRRGAALLLEMLEQPDREPVHVRLPGELMLRTTTGPPGAQVTAV